MLELVTHRQCIHIVTGLLLCARCGKQIGRVSRQYALMSVTPRCSKVKP